MIKQIWLAGLVASVLALASGGAVSARDRSSAPRAPVDFTVLWTLGSLTALERPDDFKSLTISDPQALAHATDGDPTGGARQVERSAERPAK